MPYNEDTAQRVRSILISEGGHITEKKMFGGLSFLYKGKMAIGIVGDDLAVRIIPEKYEDHVERPSVRPMDFTGKPMKEFIFVEPEAFKKKSELNYWIDIGIEHAKYKLK